jgi:hypothetical protein
MTWERLATATHGGVTDLGGDSESPFSSSRRRSNNPNRYRLSFSLFSIRGSPHSQIGRLSPESWCWMTTIAHRCSLFTPGVPSVVL